MRAVLALITIAVIVAFLAALFLLRGCLDEEVTSAEAAAESPESGVATAETVSDLESVEGEDASSVERAEESVASSAEGGTPPSSRQTEPAAPESGRSTGRSSAAQALSAARSAAGKADQIAGSDPGEAFQLYAEAFAAVSAHPADAACQQMADSLRPKIEGAAARANAGISATSDKTLIEQ